MSGLGEEESTARGVLYSSSSGAQVLARIRGYADAEHAPEQFPTAPAAAVPKALQAAGLSLADMDYYEINEAFSVVDLVNQKLLSLDPER